MSVMKSLAALADVPKGMWWRLLILLAWLVALCAVFLGAIHSHDGAPPDSVNTGRTTALDSLPAGGSTVAS